MGLYSNLYFYVELLLEIGNRVEVFVWFERGEDDIYVFSYLLLLEYVKVGWFL